MPHHTNKFTEPLDAGLPRLVDMCRYIDPWLHTKKDHGSRRAIRESGTQDRARVVSTAGRIELRKPIEADINVLPMGRKVCAIERNELVGILEFFDRKSFFGAANLMPCLEIHLRRRASGSCPQSITKL